MEKLGKNSERDYIIDARRDSAHARLHTLLQVHQPAPNISTMLTINDHSRDSAGMTYVYPVISRRAGGVSVGINLNTNNACNWACVYCQVPGLVRGGPTPVNLERLESELRHFLADIISGDFMTRHVPPAARHLMDIAISGNGEPTSAAEFSDAIETIGRVMREFRLLSDADGAESVKLRLITNGSFMHRDAVRRGIAQLGSLGGEVWFKLDRASEAGIERTNRIRLTPEKVLQALVTCADLAPTWVQTCYFAIDGLEPDDPEQEAYLALIRAVRKKIKGVLLYGLARPSMQPEASRLSNVTPECFQQFAEKILALGVELVATP